MNSRNQPELFRVSLKSGVTSLPQEETRRALTDKLTHWGADPFSSGQSDNERTWRDVEADRLPEPFFNDDAEEYVDVPREVEATTSALQVGVSRHPAKPTLKDAFDFYRKEKRPDDAEKQRKFDQRMDRAERDLFAVVRGDKFLTGPTRKEAREWRDARASKVAWATVRREKNVISAVISLALSELSEAGDNPFKGLKLKASSTAPQKERLPLTQHVIDAVYCDLTELPELATLWAVLEQTGARPSEVRML